jgi:LEA14-like dessication related protein
VKNLFLFGGIAALLAGLVASVHRELYLAYWYCYKILKFNIVSFKDGVAEIDILFSIGNISSLDIEIKNYTLDLYLEGVFCSKIQGTTSSLIRAKTASKFNMRFAFIPKKIFTQKIFLQILNGFLQKQDVDIELRGVLNVKHSFLNFKDVPFVYKTTYKDFFVNISPNPTDCEKLLD